jgi:hypothetical protein
MKKLFFFALALCLIAPLGMTQTADRDPSRLQAAPANIEYDRAFGDENWYFPDLNAITGGSYHLGCEFDGTNYWVTDGAPSGSGLGTCYISEITPGGTLVNRYPQPAACNDTWGFRDMAWDGSYLYVGSEAYNTDYITQINPATGQPTGVSYGPLLDPGLSGLARGIAYDAKTDVFLVNNWSSPIFKVTRASVVTVWDAGPGLSTYGLAINHELDHNRKLWLWYYTGAGDFGMEYDWRYKKPTGRGIIGEAGATCGGCACYALGNGDWELAAVHQANSMSGYDLGQIPSLDLISDDFLGMNGGTINFVVTAPDRYVGRDYLMWVSHTGTGPETLPGGLQLPITYDAYTVAALVEAINGNPNFVDYIGTLSTGTPPKALPEIIVPPTSMPADFELYFACTLHSPFNWGTNGVSMTILADPPPEYAYDDGTHENNFGFGGGYNGVLVWFDPMPGYPTIAHLRVAWGPSTNGAPVTVCVWDDPNNDGSPSDLVATPPLSSDATGTVQDPDSGTFYTYDIPDVTISSRFFIGWVINYSLASPDYYPWAVDQNGPNVGVGTNEVWLVYDLDGNPLDINNMGNMGLFDLYGNGYVYPTLTRGGIP